MNDYTQAPWTPRDWQVEALEAVRETIDRGRPVVRAVMGAGKSGVIAEICWQTAGKVVVTTPTKKLVDELAETIGTWGTRVGKFYTDEKSVGPPVIVCCNDSLPSLAESIDPPDLWICDEAHRSECDTLHDVIRGPLQAEGGRDVSEAWTPERRVGFTATPYRADDSEELQLFDRLAYDYGPADAIQDGVVVPPRVRHYQGSADDLDEACVELIVEDAVDRGPGVVDAITIDDCESFADRLDAAGINAKPVHSEMHERTVHRRIGRLESGELDCLVHVSLLSEGVDMPWLRWLCCRRPISSRVRFAQYVGRGLRDYPGKDCCWIYDPQDLFGDLSLDYGAVLAGGGEEGGDDEIPEMPALEVDWSIEQLEEARASGADQQTLEDARVEVVDTTTSYLRRLRLGFQSAGLIEMEIGDREWRAGNPTTNQLERIERDAWLATEPEVPDAHSTALREGIRRAKHLDRGTVSDLISILDVLRYGWPEAGEEVAA